MKINSDVVPIQTASQFVTDVGVTLYEGRFYMAIHIPINGVNCIAMRVSDDGVNFSEPRVILRPNSKMVGATRGAETPSAPMPPFPGFPFWSMICMTYDVIPGHADHWSVGTLAFAKDPLGFWQWGDIVFSSIHRRQQPTWDGMKVEGGLSEFTTLHVGSGVVVALFATNSYRPKPCIYGAVSLPPWSMRSWAMNPDPVIEGEGSMLATQPHLFLLRGVPMCVYTDGEPSRVRVARGDSTLTKWEIGEVLVEPSGVVERCVGPCLVPLDETMGRLYYTEVSMDNTRWQTMTCEVEL